MSSMIYDILYTEPTAGNTLIRAHILCDTAADLPAYNAYSGYELLMGSRADDLSTGDVYKMQSGGSWVRQPIAQSDTYTTTQIDNLLADKIPYSMPGSIPATDDLDTYTTPGTYDMAAGVTNSPTGSAGRIDIIEIPGTGMVQQRYTGAGSTSRLYVRNLQTVSPVAWHPWVPLDTLAAGIGIALSNGDDLNNRTTYGVYVAASTAIASSILHRPDYGSSGSKMFILRVEANRFKRQQTLTTVDISSGANYGNLEFFARIGEADGSRWGSWHQTTTTIVADHT